MNESETFLVKWNKSMRLTIPHAIRERLDIEIGDLLRVTIESEKKEAEG